MPYVQRKLNEERLKPVGITAATGWWATITSESPRPLVAWALLDDGEIVGLVEEARVFVSAEHLLNFSGFRGPSSSGR
jgi:hypothetical protein